MSANYLLVTLNLVCGILAARPAGGQAAPAFAKYPAGARYAGPGAAPRLRPGTAAWYFRTRIREAAVQPPNFAGHYVLATWGCGTECVSYVIINAKTGAVYFDNRTVCCWGTAVPDDFEPVRGQLDSRLLVCTGQLNEEGPNKAHRYLFTQGKLVALP
ncbi:MAG TPA: hypothetical protein VF629_19000 [Hymenobacter sp.]|uniref:hypothetical protein n=1 Tax=Hymenobacter sp. TaxID=1898978 RepID=UPI002EDA74A1